MVDLAVKIVAFFIVAWAIFAVVGLVALGIGNFFRGIWVYLPVIIFLAVWGSLTFGYAYVLDELSVMEWLEAGWGRLALGFALCVPPAMLLFVMRRLFGGAADNWIEEHE
jgi:hypothetical protein